MKRIPLCITVLLGPLAIAGYGQEWYVGGFGGFDFAPSLNVSGPSGSATAGFKNSVAAGAFLGGDTHRDWSGEVRYLYRPSDLKLQSGGTSTQFSANTSVLTADVLWHMRPRESPIRPFVAVGAGMKFLNGTGTQSASQPLGNFAALTHTLESVAVGDVGVGVKVDLHRSWQLRFEVHDYIGPTPHEVIAPAPGASLSSWMNDIIVTASIAYRW